MGEEHLTKDEERTDDGAAAEDSEPATLEEQLSQAQAKADEYMDGWQRAVAELANFRKRTEGERAEMRKMARVSVMGSFLDIMDDLDRALSSAPEELAEDSWFEGLAMVMRKFQSFLESEGVAEVGAEGELFDPALHEAIAHEPSEEHEEGQIIEVLQKGYVLGDKLVRPARVRVAQ